MVDMFNRPIGIFDSGVGGLTVAKEIRRLLPNESYIYIGDTARVPYGTKTPEQLLSYAREIIGVLQEKNAKAVVIACGTCCANTYDTLLAEFPGLPLIDILRPAVDVCLNFSSSTRIGLIATTATIRSGLFSRLLEAKRPDAKLYTKACPLFASMVEAGLPLNHPAMRFASQTYLTDLRDKIDALVLGCTHYPLLADVLRETLGDIELINIGEAAAIKTKVLLGELGLLANVGHTPTFEHYVTGPQKVFREVGYMILGSEPDITQL